jgi:hypothetical protein
MNNPPSVNTVHLQHRSSENIPTNPAYYRANSNSPLTVTADNAAANSSTPPSCNPVTLRQSSSPINNSSSASSRAGIFSIPSFTIMPATSESKSYVVYRCRLASPLAAPEGLPLVSRRWNHFAQFDTEWGKIYPNLHEVHQLKKASLLSLKSLEKLAEERIVYLTQYMTKLISINCLQPYIAQFLECDAKYIRGSDMKKLTGQEQLFMQKFLAVQTVPHSTQQPSIVPFNNRGSNITMKVSDNLASSRASKEKQQFVHQNKQLFDQIQGNRERVLDLPFVSVPQNIKIINELREHQNTIAQDSNLRNSNIITRNHNPHAAEIDKELELYSQLKNRHDRPQLPQKQAKLTLKPQSLDNSNNTEIPCWTGRAVQDFDPNTAQFAAGCAQIIKNDAVTLIDSLINDPTGQWLWGRTQYDVLGYFPSSFLQIQHNEHYNRPQNPIPLADKPRPQLPVPSPAEGEIVNPDLNSQQLERAILAMQALATGYKQSKATSNAGNNGEINNENNNPNSTSANNINPASNNSVTSSPLDKYSKIFGNPTAADYSRRNPPPLPFKKRVHDTAHPSVIVRLSDRIIPRAPGPSKPTNLLATANTPSLPEKRRSIMDRTSLNAGSLKQQRGSMVFSSSISSTAPFILPKQSIHLLGTSLIEAIHSDEEDEIDWKQGLTLPPPPLPPQQIKRPHVVNMTICYPKAVQANNASKIPASAASRPASLSTNSPLLSRNSQNRNDTTNFNPNPLINASNSSSGLGSNLRSFLRKISQ